MIARRERFESPAVATALTVDATRASPSSAPAVRALPRAALFVAAVACSVACRTTDPAHVPTMPLGPRAEVRLGVPGAVNTAPSLAARWPYAVLAWTATTGDEAVVYVVVSIDNGVSFSKPRPVEATRTRGPAAGLLAPRVVFGWPKAGANGGPLMPDVHLLWKGAGTATTVRAAKSVDGGRSFRDEAVRGELPAELPGPSERAPSPEQVSRAIAEVGPEDPRGIYDDCGTLLVAWTDAGADVPRVLLRRFTEGPQGPPTALQTVVVSDTTEARQPALASLLGGVILAWTSATRDGSDIALRRVGLEAICQLRTSYEGPLGSAATD